MLKVTEMHSYETKLTMKKHLQFPHLAGPIVASAALGLSLVATPVVAQTLPPALVDEARDVVGGRVEALSVLSGDYGVQGGDFTKGGNDLHTTDLTLDKFGGGGDVGDPHQLGNLPIGWQPRIQGSMGYSEAKNNYTAGPLNGDVNKFKTYAIQFGGGARFWFDDHFSLAPTFMGMYGNNQNSYQAYSQFARTNFTALSKAGLVNWRADTWSVIPGVDFSYTENFERVIMTVRSDFNYYHTESFDTSTPHLSINGDSEILRNTVDVDVPLGAQLWGHELRTGGSLSRTEFFDGVKRGLNTDHLYEIHGRIVMDFLGQLWKVQWLGLGVSYFFGQDISGWGFGADVAFRF